MDTNVMMVNNTVHVRFAHSGVAFCNMCLTPEQAADLSHDIIKALKTYYRDQKKKKICLSK